MLFIPITAVNLPEAVAVASSIFPYEYKNGVFLPAKEYAMSLNGHKDSTNFFLAKVGEETIGITGYNHHFYKPKHDEVWLAYFGIKPDHRGNGYGKKMLATTVDLIKESAPSLKTIKILTSNREDEKKSHQLYRNAGFKLYAHRKAKPYSWLYFRLNL